MKKEAFIHGFYPRTDSLIEASRSIDRNRISSKDFNTAIENDRNNLVALQKANGFRLIENDKFPDAWQDIFRPFLGHSDSLAEGPLTRTFYTNTFFRKPVVTGSFYIDPENVWEGADYANAFPEQKVTLPSPYAFAKLLEDKTTDKFQRTLPKTEFLIAKTIKKLKEKGISNFQINEPYLSLSNPSTEDFRRFSQTVSYLSLFTGVDANLFVHFSRGNSAAIVRFLEEEDIKLAGIGVDFFKTPLSQLPTNFKNPLVAGVTDSEHSETENIDNLKKLVSAIEDHARPSTLYLTHNTDLEFVAEPIAKQKIQVLGELLKS